MSATIPTYWNAWCCWTSAEMGVITHAVEEYPGQKVRARTVCGVRWEETGMLTIPEEVEPGCLRCRRILRKRGVLSDATD